MTKKQTKRTSTTKSENGLTSTEIGNIIRACHKAGVKHLEYGSLKVSFDTTSWDNEWKPVVKRKALDKTPELGDTDIVEDNEPASEEEIEELKLGNPLAYEEFMEKAHA